MRADLRAKTWNTQIPHHPSGGARADQGNRALLVVRGQGRDDVALKYIVWLHSDVLISLQKENETQM